MGSKRRHPRLSLDLLKGFEAAARHLSFTHAAQELALTQSAVSREIKTLEEQLGQPLFIRVNRGLRLTEAGQVLYRAVGEAMTLIDEATDRLGASKGGETLTVTTSVPLASMWLVPKLRRFVHLHPEVDVRSVAANQRLDLERERLDIAIRWGPPWIERPRRRAAIRRGDFPGLLAGTGGRSRPPAQASRRSREPCALGSRDPNDPRTVVRLGSVAPRDEVGRHEARRDASFLALRPGSSGSGRW